jgi:Ca-activated chloride channel homolog
MNYLRQIEQYNRLSSVCIRPRAVEMRRASATILVLAMLSVFVVTAAITIDYSYMQLLRTEMRVATDAAAKAGAEALARTEDVDYAVEEAIRFASLNRVGGENLQLRASDISLGRAVQGDSGKWEFANGGFPSNSVRVDAKTGGSAKHPAIPLFFGGVLGRADFSPKNTSIAGQQQVEVCLCLDRSGSMLFDMSGVDYAYPPNNPLLSDFTAWGDIWRNHLSPPNPNGSRWAVLADAVQVFFDEVAGFSPAPSASLVTWGSDYTMPIAPSTVYQAATVNAGLPIQADFTTHRNVITSAINQLGSQPMMGATNLSAGLDLAVQNLTGSSARTLTNKVVVLLTDGEWNFGRNPILAAEDARAAGVTVHTVSMLTGFQSDLAQVASITGGRSYTTNNAAELRNAFREVAKSLQVVMIE